MPTREQWAERFGVLGQELRASAGLTVSAMAETMGVDERTYRKYERGICSPQVIDYAWMLDQLHTPILKPLLNFIHPDVFGVAAESLDDMIDQLIHYLEEVAPDRVTQQVYYNLLGQVSDNVAPQLELVSVIQHLPLIYRVMIVKFILSVWDMAESRGELVHMDQLPPDIAELRRSTAAAEEACKKMRDGYSTITVQR